MKNILIFILALGFLGCNSNKRISLDQIKKHQQKSETYEILSTLTSDLFAGRKPGTDAYELTSSYVESFFIKNGIKPFYKNGYQDTVEVRGQRSANIVALLGTIDSAKKHILIGAHLDHLGIRESDTDSIYNGANDNASGVTAVLQLAKALSNYKFDTNVIVALFTGEESGLVGSKHLAKRLKDENVNLAYMLNFEMIGKTLTTGSNQVYITGFDKSDCANKMNAIAKMDFVKFLPAEIPQRLFRRSDNFAFYQEFGIPSHTISTFDFENYDHYHKASDEIEMLDVDNMNDVINTSTFIIGQMLMQNVELVASESEIN